MELLDSSLPPADTVLNCQTDTQQCHQSKVAWRTLRLRNLLWDRVRGTFPACFFSGSLFFFLFCVLMLWPYAGGCWEDNRPQCADRPCLPPLSPPFPSISLPYRATNQPLWEPSTALTARAGLKHPPNSIPARDTFRSHPPHTARLCALTLPPKPVSFAVWLKLGFAELHCLIHYTTYWWATDSAGKYTSNTSMLI